MRSAARTKAPEVKEYLFILTSCQKCYRADMMRESIAVGGNPQSPAPEYQPFAQGVGAGVSQNGSTASSGIMPSGVPAMAISRKHMSGL